MKKNTKKVILGVDSTLIIRQSYFHNQQLTPTINNMNILLNQLESELSEAIKSWKHKRTTRNTTRVLQLQVKIQKLKGL